MNDITVDKREKAKMTALEQLKKLDEQRAKLLEDAKKEALANAESAVTELNAIGFNYRLVEGEEQTKKSGGKGKPRQKSDICPTCKFGTEPPHDGRHKGHRDQGDNKKPFTDKQLADLGLKKKA